MDETIYRGQRAKEILENELFKENITALREFYISAALGCDIRDDLGKTRCLEGLRMVERFKGHLAQIVHTGDMAQEAEKLKTRPTVAERVVRLF